MAKAKTTTKAAPRANGEVVPNPRNDVQRAFGESSDWFGVAFAHLGASKQALYSYLAEHPFGKRYTANESTKARRALAKLDELETILSGTDYPFVDLETKKCV